MQELNTDTCDLSGVNIVEAGAGTGKTYSIQKLVLRLVLEKEIPLPKVLVVTFTEAATGELMDRLHAILQLTQEALEAVETGQDIFTDGRYEQIKGILEDQKIDDAGNRARCRRLIQDALCDYDQAAVMTIHGFCQRMLQTNAFLSFVRYGVEVRPDISELNNTIAMDFCRKLFYNEESPFAGSPIEPKDLLEDANAAISNAYNGAKIIWPKNTELLEMIKNPGFWSQAKCPLFANVPRINKPGKVFLAEQGVQTLQELAEIIIRAITNGNFRFVWSICCVLQKENMIKYIGNNNNTRGMVFENPAYSDFFKVMQAVSVDITHQFFDFYKKQLEVYKAKEGFMTYDDLIHKMHQVVISDEGTELRRVIREMFTYVFVDECQDTDPCQYEIFNKIFNEGILEDESRGFFMIGDPKQAIYSFRGGDLDAYLSAVGQVPEDHRYSLTRNFRSGKKFINALNAFYANWQNPFERSSIQLETIQHGRAIDNLYHGHAVDEKPLQFIRLDNKEAVLEWTVNKVLDLLSNQRYSIGHEADPENGIAKENRPVKADDIAILFPTKSQGGELEERLNQEGIDTIWLSESDIFQQPEAKTVWRFLDMLYGGARMPDIAAVLSDSLFMCTAKELQTFQQEAQMDRQELQTFQPEAQKNQPEGQKDQPEGQKDQPEAQQNDNDADSPCVQAQRYFQELRKIWETKGIYAMFQKFLYEPNEKGRKWLCKIRENEANNLETHFKKDSSLAMHIIQTDDVNGRYIFGRIRQLVDKLHRVAQKRHLTPGRLLAYLQGMINQDKELEDSGMEHNVQRNTDKPAVRLLTLHHSKGLEFPIVLLPNVITHKNTRVKDRLFHDAKEQRSVDMTGEHSKECADEDAKKQRSVDMTGEHSKECADEFRQEKLRLLYVGLTRAKYACYAPYSTNRAYGEVAETIEALPNFAVFQGNPEHVTTEYLGGDDVEASTQACDFGGKAVWDWQVGSFTGFKGSFHNDNVSEITPAEPANGGDDEKSEESEAETIVPSVRTGNELPGDDEQEVIFTFAAGKEAGTIWHEIFEKMDFKPDALGNGECFDEKTELDLVRNLPRQSLYQAIQKYKKNDEEEQKKRDKAFARMLKGILCNPMGASGETFMLKDILRERRASELRFLYVLKKDTTLHDIKVCLERNRIPTGDWAEKAQSGRLDWALTGSIDLLCQTENGKYYVIDWKTNGLNRAMGNFTRDGMEREINKKLYSLQYLLYTVAFWHFLKERQGIELTEENYQKHFGGVLYLFVRGMAAPLETMTETERQLCQKRGIYYALPPFKLISEMMDLLDIRSKH